MPKKNLLISAALTAFILVIVTGVASAYQRVNMSIAAVKAETADAALPAAEVAQVPLSHQEAALVAANHMGQTDLYSVENVVWEGVDAYEVIFSTGDTVYISMTGEVLDTEAPEPVVVIEEQDASSSNANSSTNARSSSRSTSSDDDYDDDDDDHYEEDDDHEEVHDDD